MRPAMAPRRAAAEEGMEMGPALSSPTSSLLSSPLQSLPLQRRALGAELVAMMMTMAATTARGAATPQVSSALAGGGRRRWPFRLSVCNHRRPLRPIRRREGPQWRRRLRSTVRPPEETMAATARLLGAKPPQRLTSAASRSVTLSADSPESGPFVSRSCRIITASSTRTRGRRSSGRCGTTYSTRRSSAWGEKWSSGSSSSR